MQMRMQVQMLARRTSRPSPRPARWPPRGGECHSAKAQHSAIESSVLPDAPQRACSAARSIDSSGSASSCSIRSPIAWRVSSNARRLPSAFDGSG